MNAVNDVVRIIETTIIEKSQTAAQLVAGSEDHRKAIGEIHGLFKLRDSVKSL